MLISWEMTWSLTYLHFHEYGNNKWILFHSKSYLTVDGVQSWIERRGSHLMSYPGGKGLIDNKERRIRLVLSCSALRIQPVTSSNISNGNRGRKALAN